MHINAVYKKIIGNPPAPHQERTWEFLSRSQPVVLRAPTGSGKTEAIVLPFLKFCGDALPAHLLYALPLRSLANQTAKRINKYAKALNKPQSWRARLQHGQAPESVLFTADAVVATIDQIIASYACTPLTLPVRHGNIPAGAVMSSLLVFDEIHLFDPHLALQAVRLICERLHRLGLPYAVLSATLPDSVVDLWRKSLGAEIVEAEGEFVKRKVNVKWRGRLLDASALKEALREGHSRILVVCNTVDRAISLFQSVHAHAKARSYECNLLHSRFLTNDRISKEEWVLRHFGKSARSKAKSLLITTQVVEVGLDISCDYLLTELAPIDALIQRAGRCARWGGNGIAKVFEVEISTPYRDDLIDRTRHVLQRDNGTYLTWDCAKAWVNEVLNEHYRNILTESNAYEQVIFQLSRAAFEGSRSQAEAAVRDINTVEVAVHSNPQDLRSEVLRLPTISVRLGVVKKWINKHEVWRVEVDRGEAKDAALSVRLEPVKREDITIGDRIILPATVLTYSPELGLRPGTGRDFVPETTSASSLPKSSLRRETWIEHVKRVVDKVGCVLSEEQHGVHGLARFLDVKEDQVQLAAKLAAFFHDLGKLTVEWQRKAGVSESAFAEELLAHTDGRDYIQFPPHATVSAYALWDALVESSTLPRILARTALFAISHHHSVRAKEVPRYRFHASWRHAVEQAMQRCGLARALNLDKVLTSQDSTTSLRDSFPPLEYERLYTAYVLLSRWLRLADRLATGGEDALLRYENWFGRL